MIAILLVLIAADPLTGILARMDANAEAFKGVKANLKQISHNAAVDIDTEKSGTMTLKRPAPHDLRLLVRFNEPAAQQVYVGGGVADIYYPKINTVQERKLGKYQAAVEQFYLLAFGGSGKELAANYELTYIGAETIGGARCSHLQLIPKSAEVRKSYAKIELWLTDPNEIPAQLRLVQPSGDTQTLIYSDVKMNPKISSADLELKTAAGVKKEYPAQ